MSELSRNVARAFELANHRRELLAEIKALVCGDAEPNWPNDPRVTAMRGRIADICDRPAPPQTSERT